MEWSHPNFLQYNQIIIWHMLDLNPTQLGLETCRWAELLNHSIQISTLIWAQMMQN